VAVRYSLYHPDRVARLLLISPPVFAQGPQPLSVAAAQPAARSAPAAEPPPVSGGVRRLPSLDGPERSPFGPLGGLPAFRPPAGLSRPPAQSAPPRNPIPEVQPDPAANPLRRMLLDVTPAELLAQHLERETPDYDRHMTEAAKATPAALAASATSFDRVNLTLEIRHLETPTLLLHGQDDRFLPPPGERVIDLLGGNRPTLRCEIVPSVGHFPMLSDPASFQRLIMDFLEAADLTGLVLHKERWVRRVR